MPEPGRFRTARRRLPVRRTAAARAAGRTPVIHALAVLGCVIALLHARGSEAESSILDEYPGRRVGVGTHELHLDCRGRGQPLIVFESGLGGLSLEWQNVRDLLGDRYRTCAYDRAGYGWSDPGPLPRTADRNASELRALLQNSGETGPYLLVGHSYGGIIARVFTERFPELVAGLVLLDASAPEQFARLPASVLPSRAITRLGHSALLVSTPMVPQGVAAADRITAQHLMMLPKARHAYQSELRHFEQGTTALRHQRDGSFEAPLVVVSRARNMFGASAAGMHGERIWLDLQRNMSRLSARADHWIAAGAGHVIHADRPDLVTLAVRELADSEVRDWPVGPFDSSVRLVLSAPALANGNGIALTSARPY